jgi:phosphate acetyltransferase
MEVGQSKMQIQRLQDSKCAYFPDLNTGNNTYKAVQRETGALAIGPMLQ